MRQIELNSRKGGFSLLELVVALAILGLLAALLLPAVQHARQSSRRIVCQNNLRQVGLAIANVEQSTGTFPTSRRPQPSYWRLLPYLDAAAIAEALIAERNPGSFAVPTLICPDDAIAAENMPTRGEANYFFNDGTQLRVAETNGFRKSSRQDTAAADVTDGLSHTAAMSERLVRPGVRPLPTIVEMERETRRYFWWTERRFKLPGEEAYAIEQCRHHRTTVDPQFAGLNAFNLRGNHGYDHMLPPNHPACYNGPEDFDVHADVFLIPASSLHPTGVNTLFGDGSVHFVSENIDATVWQALGTRNGNDVVDGQFGS